MAQARVHWLITNVQRERRHNVGVDVLNVTFRAAHKSKDGYESIWDTRFVAVVQANYGSNIWYGLRFTYVDAHRSVVKALEKLVSSNLPFQERLIALKAVFATNKGSEYYWQYRACDAPEELKAAE